MKLHSDYPESGCWELRGYKTKDGYRKVAEGGITYQAHRYAYMRLRFPQLTPNILLLHRCDNPPCWNPDHMQPGTHAENQADKVAKNRQYRPIHLRLDVPRRKFSWILTEI